MKKTPRRFKTRVKKIGQPPGALIHVGEKLSEKIKITLMEYDGSNLREKIVEHAGEIAEYRNEQTVTWVHVDGLHDTAFLECLGADFGLHPLTVEDILNTDQRPKADDYSDYLFVVLKAFSLPDAVFEEIQSEQISIVFGNRFLLSFAEKESSLLDPIRTRIRNNEGHIRRSGPDYLAYRIIDAVVDQYFIVLEKLGEDIEVAEENLIARPVPETLQSIQHLKREMLYLRKSVWPLREAVNCLERRESTLVSGQTVPYLKDVYDHTIQVIDTIETYRDMLSAMLDIYLSSLSNRLNEVMKVLTIIATIFMPLTFIAGVYGMNFKNMPELNWQWGYYGIWCVMITIALSMIAYFKKKKWL
ncbi:MAG: Cobalt/magnesium transport protein CorA [Syntrophus sp. SKADARSKE-3]|nr:Cobalt/magnesium transport protein CorA [Syntrophus sp. SKADARSKE-3]